MLATDGYLVTPNVNIFQFEMQLRLFRHFIPVSVVLLASSDALLITGAFYQVRPSSWGFPASTLNSLPDYQLPQ